MGVKIKDLITSRRVEFSEMKGRIVAIDAPNIISALLNYSKKTGGQGWSGLMTDRTQRAISHLYGLLYRMIFYYSKRIFPIFCFDGRDSELKWIITKDRLNDFHFTKKRYEKLISSGDKKGARGVAMGKEFLWQNIIYESKKILGLMGVPYLESPASAESQCAQLVKERIAHFSNSQDFDSLLFGCPRTIQNLSKSRSRKQRGRWVYDKIEPKIINLKENLEKLNINQFQLIDMAILIGNDYFPGIKNIGSKNAYLLIKEHGSLEQVIKMEKLNYNFEKLTPEIINEVRKIFLFPEVIERVNSIHWNAPNTEALIEFLCMNHTLNEERVRNNVEKLNVHYDKCQSFFLKNEDVKHSSQLTLDTIF